MKKTTTALGVIGIAIVFALAGQTGIAGAVEPDNSKELMQIQEAIGATVAERVDHSLDPTLQSRTGESVVKVATPEYAQTIDEEAAALDKQRSFYAQFGEAFTSYEVAVTLDDVSFDGDTATVKFAEAATLQRTPESDGSPRPEYGYVYRQTATMSKMDGTWLVADITSAEGVPATDLPDADAQAAMADGSLAVVIGDALQLANEQKVDDDAVALSSGVNNTLVQAYAITYWDDYNPAYRVQDNDCTNFVSQALYYAGASEVTGYYTNWNVWWYTFLNQSHTWINAQMLADFGVYYDARFTAAGSGWVVGDIAFWIWNSSSSWSYDHASIVTAVGGSGEPYFTQHTADRHNESLANYYVRESDLYVADLHNT